MCWSRGARYGIGVSESAGINRLGIRNLPAGRQVKESYREDIASRSGLDPYAGGGDVAGVAPACRLKVVQQANKYSCEFIRNNLRQWQ